MFESVQSVLQSARRSGKTSGLAALRRFITDALAAPFKGLPAIGRPPNPKNPADSVPPPTETRGRRVGARRQQQNFMYGQQPCAKAFAQYARRYA